MCGWVDGWVILFDMLTFDFLLKPPQPVTGLFLFLFLFLSSFSFCFTSFSFALMSASLINFIVSAPVK